MDLVNSVTQNSNNRDASMENQGDQGEDGNGKNDDRGGFPPKQQMQAADTNEPPSSSSSSSSAPTATVTTTAATTAPATTTKSQVPDYLKAIGMDPRKFWPKKYRFTREKPPGAHNPLNISQRNFYEANGYIVIDECASSKLLDTIRLQQKESSFVNEFLLDKLVAKNGKLLQYVKCFCDERLMLMTHQLVESFQTNENARAVMDNKHAPRQQLFRDWIYLPFRPIDKVVCAITAIDPLDHVILVVPGTHRVGTTSSISPTLENISAAYETSQERTQQLMAREIFECSPENLSSLVEKSKKGFRYVNLKPGQTLFYHPGLVHGFSDDLVNFRKSQLACIAYYAAADCEYVDLRQSQELLPNNPVPLSLAHFKDKNPSDYSAWIDRPILLQEPKASL